MDQYPGSFQVVAQFGVLLCHSWEFKTYGGGSEVLLGQVVCIFAGTL